MDNNQRNKGQNKQISEGIKETAGAAFHAVHSALETTENVAMTAVDATANAVGNVAEAGRNLIPDEEGRDNR